MIQIKLSGKANTKFWVKNPKKIEMWRMLAQKSKEHNAFIFVDIIGEK